MAGDIFPISCPLIATNGLYSFSLQLAHSGSSHCTRVPRVPPPTVTFCLRVSFSMVCSVLTPSLLSPFSQDGVVHQRDPYRGHPAGLAHPVPALPTPEGGSAPVLQHPGQVYRTRRSALRQSAGTGRHRATRQERVHPGNG